MKKNVSFFILTLCFCVSVQAQREHSPHNLELGLGIEGFTTFTPLESDIFTGTFERHEPIKGAVKWMPLLSFNYRKIQDSGNYFGISGSFGGTKWLNENASRTIISNSGQLTAITFSEEQEEGTLAFGYIQSFLITKENSKLKLYLGGEGSVYDNFAQNRSLESIGSNTSHRNIFGVRLSYVPELMYQFPNNRMTASFRAKLPLFHIERNRQSQRFSTFNSFFSNFVHNSVSFFAIARTRFELGIGYFWEME